MPRLIQPSAGNSLGDYLERLVKLVPVEIIAAYMVLRGGVGSGGDNEIPPAIEIAGYIALVALTPFYLWRVSGHVAQVRKQLVIATTSFVVWSYAIGGPFFWPALERMTSTKIVYPGVAGLLVVLWSVALGAFAPTAPAPAP